MELSLEQRIWFQTVVGGRPEKGWSGQSRDRTGDVATGRQNGHSSNQKLASGYANADQLQFAGNIRKGGARRRLQYDSSIGRRFEVINRRFPD